MKKLFLLLCLMALVVGCPPTPTPTPTPTPSSNGTLHFVNNTGHAATVLFASPSSSSSWGSNVLSSDVASGSSRDITGIAPDTSYDFRAEFANGGYAETSGNVFDAGETLSWTLSAGDLTGGSNVSQAVLDIEQEAFDLVNGERVNAGLSALTMRQDLREVARAHSEDMLARDFFDHINPDGDDPFDRMGAAGVTYSSAAENIAWNSGYGASTTASVAVDGWMNSTGHRTNILTAAFTHTGMGVATDGTQYYYTQVFILPAKSGDIMKIKTWAAAQ